VELYVYTCGSDCESVGNISGSHFVKAFSALRRIFNGVSSITEASTLQVLISMEGTGKISWSQVRRVLGNTPVLSH
jgi:hypothetical protein